MEEIENELVGTESDASEGASSDASSDNSDNGDAAKAASSKEQPDTSPFHEHPRFKELVEQKNQALEAQRSLESKLAQLEARFNQPAKEPAKQAERDELIEDLKKIDPRLAERLERATKSFSSVEQLQQKLEAFERSQQESAQQQVLQSAVAKINQMHESNKVPELYKQLINTQLDMQYRDGKLSPRDPAAIEKAYKTAYDSLKAYEENLKRETLKSYVPGKTQDAKVPTSQPKGQPAKAAPKKPAYSQDKETAKAQIVEQYLKQRSREREASST